MTGAGGYSYLYEPLWWAGMITSESGFVLWAELDRIVCLLHYCCIYVNFFKFSGSLEFCMLLNYFIFVV